jgi:hypothetical protein
LDHTPRGIERYRVSSALCDEEEEDESHGQLAPVEEVPVPGRSPSHHPDPADDPVEPVLSIDAGGVSLLEAPTEPKGQSAPTDHKRPRRAPPGRTAASPERPPRLGLKDFMPQPNPSGTGDLSIAGDLQMIGHRQYPKGDGKLIVNPTPELSMAHPPRSRRDLQPPRSRLQPDGTPGRRHSNDETSHDYSDGYGDASDDDNPEAQELQHKMQQLRRQQEAEEESRRQQELGHQAGQNAADARLTDLLRREQGRGHTTTSGTASEEEEEEEGAATGLQSGIAVTGSVGQLGGPETGGESQADGEGDLKLQYEVLRMDNPAPARTRTRTRSEPGTKPPGRAQQESQGHLQPGQGQEGAVGDGVPAPEERREAPPVVKGRQGRHQRSHQKKRAPLHAEAENDSRPSDPKPSGMKQRRADGHTHNLPATYDSTRQFLVNKGITTKPAEEDALDQLLLKATTTAQPLVSLDEDPDAGRSLIRVKTSEEHRIIGSNVRLFRRDSEFDSLKLYLPAVVPAAFTTSHPPILQAREGDKQAPFTPVELAPLPPAIVDDKPPTLLERGRFSSTSQLLNRRNEKKERLFMFGRGDFQKVMEIHLQHLCPPLWDGKQGFVRRGSI